MHYVIGDVHGCYKELMHLLRKIELQDSDAEICFVGDLFDRGPEVWKVLEWALEHISLEGRYRCVRGNHEEMILGWYKEWMKWWNAGGFSENNPLGLMPETAYDFSKWADSMNALCPEKLEPIIRLIREMPYNRIIDVKTSAGENIRFRVVHAWHSEKEGLTRIQKRNINLWSRNEEDNYESDEIIVHGHTPTIRSCVRPGMIEYRNNAINVDGGCCYKEGYSSYPCMLCGLRLETLEEFYPYTLKERYEQFEKEGLLLKGFKADDYLQNYEKRYMYETDIYREELLKRLSIYK